MSLHKQPLISVKNLSKSFNKRKILDSISFDLTKNEILGIVGFSGEGKSTLLNLICGLDSQDSGKIEFEGKSRGKGFIEVRKKLLGYSSQNHSYYDELTLIENLFYFGTLYKLTDSDIESRVNLLLEKFDLDLVKNNVADSLSEGQKKRLDLACSLIHKPKVLILDEPTANLDFKLRDELLEYILQIKETGVSVIFVSHNLEEVEHICDRVLMLNNTKLNDLHHPKDVKNHFDKCIKDRYLGGNVNG